MRQPWRVLLRGFLIAAATIFCVAAWGPSVALRPSAQQLPGWPLYDKLCLACHGAAGDGRGPAASYTRGIPRDFTAGAYAWRSTPSGQGPTRDDLRLTLRHGARRMVAAYMLGSAALLFVAVVLVAVAARRAGVAAPLSLPDLQAVGGAALEPWRVLPLLLTAIVIRKGAFPFHSWIPALSSHAGPAAPALLVGPQVGAFVLVRVAIPLFPEALADALPIIGRVALLAALYGSVVGLAGSDLRRVYGWLVVSQSSLVLVGLECTDADGIAGGLVLWLSAGLALTALGVVIEGVEARIGMRSLDRFAGLRAPRLGALFLLLGLASVGLPGTLGFVAEDLLVHGVLESYPGIGAVIILATAANGFSVMRAFVRTFYGPVDRDVAVSDVLPRESLVLGGAVVLLVVAGMWPRPIIDTRAPVAERLSALLGAHDRE